jgi:hypothetical protein
LTHWELKHLSGSVPKNELLVFNGKGLDFLYGSTTALARTPIFRFLLSGGDVRDECRVFAALWGITIIEPGRLPLALLCEAVARGANEALSGAEVEAVRHRASWACRPLQQVVTDLSLWVGGDSAARRYCGPRANFVAKEVLDIQEQLGASVLDWLDERQPDWIDDSAEETWELVGGW